MPSVPAPLQAPAPSPPRPSHVHDGVRSVRPVRRGHRAAGAADTVVRPDEPVEHAAHQVVRGRHVHIGPTLPMAVGQAAQRPDERVRGPGRGHDAAGLHVPARQRRREIGRTR